MAEFMKIVVTCGSPWSDLSNLEEILKSGGMQCAKSARKDASENIHSFHERVYKLYCKDTINTNELTAINLSKPWEQMASNIFEANVEQDCWGWSNAYSTWFLDFWQNFDPNFRFILAYTSPQKELAQLVHLQSSESSIQEFIQTWLAYNQKLLKFFRQHPNQSILIDYCCLPTTFVKRCNENLKLNLSDKVSTPAIKENKFVLAELLAQQLLGSSPEVIKLFDELEKSAQQDSKVQEQGLFFRKRPKQPFQEATNNIDKKNLFLDAINEYQQLYENSQEISNLKENNLRLTDEIKALKLQWDDIEKRQQLEQQKVFQENELLVLQLSQVQEELEHYFIENQSLTTSHLKASETWQAQLNQTNQEKQQVVEVKNNLEQQVATLNEELKSQLSRHNQYQQENELISLQLHQAQEELEHYFVENQSLQNKLNLIAQDKELLVEAKNNLEHRVNEVDSVRSQLELSNTQLTEILKQQQSKDNINQQENELLLLQLHQVQEELEHYFLEYQALQVKNQETLSRLNRIYSRYPDYYDYTDIEVSEIETQEDYHAVKWKIDCLLIGNKVIASLAFKTVVNQGQLGLLFEQEDSQSLLSWSLSANNVHEIFIPLLDENDKQTLGLGCQFAATDWVMLKGLFNIMSNALQQETVLFPEIKAKLVAENWLERIGQLNQAYLLTASVFRFDEVFLYKEQINPDYEHLWFKFNNVRFADQYWSVFQFRLAAANIRPGQFSVYPKLEFPLADNKTLPFEKWFIEINDAMGERMELRFALTPPAIDMQIWNSFSKNDQAIIASIIEQIPNIVELNEKQGRRIKRPYAEWKKLANDIFNVFNLLITVE